MAVAPDLLLTPVRVRFPRPRLLDVAETVRQELLQQRAHFPARGRIAVAVGSRGVANLRVIVETAVRVLQSWGLEAFVVPAMGSHGGASADGQRQLLASYGITHEGVGCPVHSSMDVVTLPAPQLPHGLYMDRHAFESDGVLLVNRIKPHTDFRGRYESGLVKMAVIGLGKERQASAIHRFGVPGLRDGIPRAAESVLATGKILAGLGVVENAYDETMAIELVPADRLLDREPHLLELARANMPALPIDALDVLIVDRLGKDISGTGMDTNIIGRMRIAGEAEPERPRIRMIAVTDLTDASHGNATGVGLADVITKRLYEKLDVDVTYTNVFTSGFPERGKIPIVAPTDADAYAAAARACGPIAPHELRVVRILDTLHVGEIYASPGVIAALGVETRTDIETPGTATTMFDAAGALTPFLA